MLSFHQYQVCTTYNELDSVDNTSAGIHVPTLLHPDSIMPLLRLLTYSKLLSQPRPLKSHYVLISVCMHVTRDGAPSNVVEIEARGVLKYPSKPYVLVTKTSFVSFGTEDV